MSDRVAPPRFLIRSARLTDVDALVTLAKSTNMINMPAEREAVEERVGRSERSFSGRSADQEEALYILVAESETGEVIGTSSIIAQHGTKDDPHVSLRVAEQEMYAPSIDRLMRHRTLKLSFTYDGPTEIGGLLLNPAYRGATEKVGLQLSFARFLYIACRPQRFRTRVIAEMMPPHVAEGWSPLWDALGHRLTGLSYAEADRLSRKNKEFILELFPHEEIYASLLPDEAQSVIGKVAPETEAALRLLKSIGFRDANTVDPFDGGPHIIAETQELSIIRSAFGASLAPATSPLDGATKTFLIGHEKPSGEFVAVAAPGRQREDRLECAQATLERLQVNGGAVGFAVPLNTKST